MTTQNVYIEPVTADFWQLFKEPGSTSYLDPEGPKDCMTHTAARAVMRACEGIRPAGTPGAWPPTGYEIRRHCIDPVTGKPDISGGVNHGQVQEAVKRLYNVELTLYYGNSFDDMVDLLDETHGVMASLRYERIRDTATRRGDWGFTGNHEIWIPRCDRAAGVFKNVVDPLANGGDFGRPAGLYHGPGDYSFSLIKPAMGELNISRAGGYQALGFGKGYFAVTKATGTPPSTGTSFRVVISGYTNLYTGPNGRRVAAVTKATYVCARSLVAGQWWFHITSESHYQGRYFRANSNMEAHRV